MWKKILIILAFLIPFGLLVWYLVDKGMKVWDKITFTPYVKEVDLKGKTWADLIQALGSLAGFSENDLDVVTMGVDIKNDSDLTIPITNFVMKLYYPVEVDEKGNVINFGTEVASTSPDLEKQKIVVQKNSTTTITDKIHLYLNGDAGKLLVAGGLKKKPDIGYKIALSAWGIPIPARFRTGTFKWEY